MTHSVLPSFPLLKSHIHSSQCCLWGEVGQVGCIFILFCLFIFSLFTLQLLCVYIMASNLMFLWESWMCKWVCLCIYIWSMYFPWAPFLLFDDVLAFALSYSILLYYYHSEACLFSKRNGSIWEGMWGGNGKSRGRRNYNFATINLWFSLK